MKRLLRGLLTVAASTAVAMAVSMPALAATRRTGYGSTFRQWNATHQNRDPNFMGAPAYGPMVPEPGGAWPEFLLEFVGKPKSRTPLTWIIYSLPTGTSAATAERLSLPLFPAGTRIKNTFVDHDGNGGSCKMVNVVLPRAVAGTRAAHIELGYDAADTSVSWRPSDINTSSLVGFWATPGDTC